jgi:hypothetical protein
MRFTVDVALLIVVAVYATTLPALAYLDPGSTSMILQTIVGSVAAAIVLTRRFWAGTLHRARLLFGRDRTASPNARASGDSGK